MCTRVYKGVQIRKWEAHTRKKQKGRKDMSEQGVKKSIIMSVISMVMLFSILLDEWRNKYMAYQCHNGYRDVAVWCE